MIFVSHNYSPKVLQPRKKSLDFPSPFGAAQNSAVLRLRFLSIGFMRRNQLNVQLFQLVVERIRIICFVADYSARSFISKSLADCSLDKPDFARRSTCRVNGERKTKAVCHCHEFRALVPLGFSDPQAPFLADTNVPSIKVSDKSNLPRSSKSWANVSNSLHNLPSRARDWKRRWRGLVWRKSVGQIRPPRAGTQNP